LPESVLTTVPVYDCVPTAADADALGLGDGFAAPGDGDGLAAPGDGDAVGAADAACDAAALGDAVGVV